MDYRCPTCRADLGKGRLIDTVVTRMETDCSLCRSRIRLNVHRAETVVVLASFAAVMVLGAIAYWLKSEGWALATFGAAMLGSLALPAVEKLWLRRWPRYVPADGSRT